MSEILLRWLNDEVRLAVPVANFEEDFANGYSFGELLDRHQMQPDFHLFIDGDHPGAPRPALGSLSRTRLTCSRHGGGGAQMPRPTTLSCWSPLCGRSASASTRGKRTL